VTSSFAIRCSPKAVASRNSSPEASITSPERVKPLSIEVRTTLPFSITKRVPSGQVAPDGGFEEKAILFEVCQQARDAVLPVCKAQRDLICALRKRRAV